MKTFRHLALLAAAALMLLPTSCRKSSESTSTDLEACYITFAEESLSILVGASSYNQATVSDADGNALNISVNWSSGNTDCVYVDSSTGTVRGIAAGTATIKAYTSATDDYAATSATYKVTVTEESSSNKSVSLSFSVDKLYLDLAGTKYGSSAYAVATVYDSSGNEISGITVSYESNDESYATVSSAGLVTAVASGTTYIIATTEETTISGVTYSASTASLKVKVVNSGTGSDDDGDSSSDIDPTSADDEVAYFSEEYKMAIAYSSGSASITITDANGDSVSSIDGVTVSKSGARVTVTNESDYLIHYVLSGSSSSGLFKLYSSRKQEIELSSLTLTGADGAAINNQSGKRTFIVLTGTNTVKDGGSYSSTPSDEDERAAFFSEGQLCFSGSGSLAVTASALSGKGGIFSDDYIRFLGGTVTAASSQGHAIRGKDAVIVSDGTVKATCSANGKKGITTDGFYQQDGGTVTVSTTGAAIYDSDEGDMAGATGVKCDSDFNMNSGTLTVTVTGAGVKGISVGGVGYFAGGTITSKASGKNRFYKSGSYSDVTSYSDSEKNTYPHSFAKGIKCDGNIYATSGYVYGSSSAHEGITTDGTWNQTGGVVIAEAYDDAVNSTSALNVSGGYLRGTSQNNDGIDANNSITISGGVVIGEGATAPECGIDSVEGTYVTVNGGYVISRGGSLNAFTTTSGKAFVQTTTSAGAKIGITSGSTQLIGYQAPSYGGTTTLLCAPAMVSGSSYTLYTSVSSITLSDSSFERFGTAFSGGSSGSSLTASSSAGNGGTGGGGGGGMGGGGSHGGGGGGRGGR